MEQETIKGTSVFLVRNEVHTTWSSNLLLLLLFKNTGYMCCRVEVLKDTGAARKLVSLASCEDKGKHGDEMR